MHKHLFIHIQYSLLKYSLSTLWVLRALRSTIVSQKTCECESPSFYTRLAYVILNLHQENCISTYVNLTILIY